MSEAPPIRRTIVTRHRLVTRYNGMYTVTAAGELLTVTEAWEVWTLADPDEIPTEHLLAIVTVGVPLPDGDWDYLTSVTTPDHVWLVFVEKGTG